MTFVVDVIAHARSLGADFRLSANGTIETKGFGQLPVALADQLIDRVPTLKRTLMCEMFAASSLEWRERIVGWTADVLGGGRSTAHYMGDGTWALSWREHPGCPLTVIADRGSLEDVIRVAERHATLMQEAS